MGKILSDEAMKHAEREIDKKLKPMQKIIFEKAVKREEKTWRLICQSVLAWEDCNFHNEEDGKH